jgi:hypothetical protein
VEWEAAKEERELMLCAVLIASCLLVSQVPASGAQTTHQATKAAALRQSPGDIATHATTGVVKTITATALVVTRRASGKRTDTTFVLTPSTHKEGALTAGSTVEVRYRTEGRQKIATAVSVEALPQ